MAGQDIDKLRTFLLQIYDDYRKAAMNKKYYGYRLASVQKYSVVMEVLIAITASSSGISGWILWQSEPGKVLWACVAGVASICAVIKSASRTTKKIEDFSKLHEGHMKVFNDFDSIIKEVEISKTFNDVVQKKYNEVRKNFGELVDEPKANKKLLEKAYLEVLEEIPVSRLWMP